jgi:hypothetical protein
MLDLILLAINIAPYIYTWRKIFKRIAYHYVGQKRGDAPLQLEPDWGDIGYGIVGATLCACLWPVIWLTIGVGVSAEAFTARHSPGDVAEKLGGKPPTEVRLALSQYKINTLEKELGMGENAPPISHKAQMIDEARTVLRGEVV